MPSTSCPLLCICATCSSSSSVISLSGHTSGELQQAAGASGGQGQVLVKGLRPSTSGGDSLPDRAQGLGRGWDVGMQLVCEGGGGSTVLRRRSSDGPFSVRPHSQLNLLQGGLGAGVNRPPTPLHAKANGPRAGPPPPSVSSTLTPSPPPTPSAAEWLRPIVALVRERDVRSLVLELVGSATREATRGTWEALFGSEGGRGGQGLLMTSQAQYQMGMVLAVVMALCMFAVLPLAKTVLA